MTKILCRSCNEPTWNRTERCGPCRTKFNNGEEVQTKVELATCTECKKPAITLEDGVCNTCLSSKDDKDMIKYPKHYNMGKIQPIDVIEDWDLDFRLASALKYIARAGKKDPTKTKQDLEKCIWYVQRFIDKECNNE